MKITIERVIIAILALVLAFSLFKSCQKNNKIDQLKDANLSLQLENQELDSIKNILGQTVTLQEVIVVRSQEELRKLSDEKFQLQNKLNRKIQEVLYYQSQTTETAIKEILIPYEDTTKLRRFKDSADFYKYALDSMITVPRTVKIDSTSIEYKNGFRFSGIVLKQGFKLNTAAFLDSQYIRVVEKKRNFWQFISFKRRPVEVQVLHTSPYLNVTGQNSVIYQPRSGGRFIEKALLIGAGVFLGSKLN